MLLAAAAKQHRLPHKVPAVVLHLGQLGQLQAPHRCIWSCAQHWAVFWLPVSLV
jgi:hypothetical protein